MTNNIDLLLRFILDQQSVNNAGTGTDGLASDLKDVENVVEALNKDFDRLEQQMKKATTQKDFESVERQMKGIEEQVNETTQAYRLQAGVLRAEAAAITDDFAKARIAQIKSINDQVAGISTAALGVGVGVVGGIFAAAAKYVKDAKEATAVTRAWKQEQLSLERSGERFGAVLAEQSLPLLQKASDMADKATDFVEKHPDVIRAALNTGVVLATLGAVGLAVTKGVKIYTDLQTLALGVQQLAAAKLQDTAADKQLAAATLQAKMAGVDIPAADAVPSKTGALGGSIALISSMVAAVLATAAIAGAAKILIDKIFPDTPQTALPNNSTTGVGSAELRRAQVALGNAIAADAPAEEIQKLRDEVKRLGQQAFNTAKEVSDASDELKDSFSLSAEDSPMFDQILKAYEDYKVDDLALVKQHYQQRQGIVQDALNAEMEANRNYANSVSQVNKQLSSSLASAASDFEKANVRAEQEFQRRRFEIIRNGNEEIEDIQRESQERLREMTQEHDDRVAALTASRDALGLAKENRQFRRDVAEEKRDTNREVRERRQEIQQRLDDLQRSYELERAQRLADYQERVAEIRAQAAERLKELAAEHQEQLRQIREQKAQKLKELDIQFAEERRRRYQYFIQQIRDADAALLGETNLKRSYYQRMLTELNTFLSNYRAGLASLATAAPAARADGGYAGFGVYRLGDTPSGGPGGVEFVMSNRTVKAAESLVGGRLTQQNLIAALAGRGQSVSVNYKGRFDGEYTGSMRRAVQRDVQSAIYSGISEVLGTT